MAVLSYLSAATNPAEAPIVVQFGEHRKRRQIKCNTKYGAKMSRPQEVNDFITKHRPKPVCNKCIAQGLGWRNDAAHPAQITGALSTTSDFVQERGRCSICGDTKQVIRSA